MRQVDNVIRCRTLYGAVRALLTAFVAALAIAAWAADEDVVAQAEKLVRAGRYAEAYQLLEPLEAKLAGDLKFDYLLARSALESGRPSKASFIYERILAVEPNYVGVRLEMGRAYLALRDYARAKLEFETVLRFEALPPDLREQALAYARAADALLAERRTVGYGYVEAGYGYDSNPLSATPLTTIITPSGAVLQPAATERGAQYYALSFGGEVIHALSERFSLYAGGDARARWHHDFDTADFQSGDARFGLGYAEGPNNVRIGLIGGTYRLDNKSLRDGYGATADWRRLVDQQNQLSLSALAVRFRFVPELFKESDFDNYQATLGWLRAVNDGRGAVGVSLLGGYENATRARPEGDKPFVGFRLNLQNAFTDYFGGFVLAGAQWGYYSEPNPLTQPNPVKRRDTLYDVTAGVTWSIAPGLSLRPQVVYVKNASNLADLGYEFDRTDVSINLRADF
jgi:tetratricopeptide (TPR) repeat protein